MKATELRILNWVQFDYKGETKQRQIVSLKFGQTLEYRPIPLTEEWLLRFGFEHLPNDNNGGTFVLEISEIPEFILKLVDLGGDGAVFFLTTIGQLSKTEPMPCKIEHVHQLQNLYFALTGRELEMK